MSPFVGADLGRAVQAADRDVAGDGGDADALGLVDLDPVRALEGDVGEPPDNPELGGARLRLHTEPAGSCTVTSIIPEGPKSWLPPGSRRARRRRDTRPSSLLGRLHVAALRGFQGEDLDRGAGPICGDDLNAVPPEISRTAVIGLGVSNFCIMIPFSSRFVFLISVTLRCVRIICKFVVAIEIEIT